MVVEHLVVVESDFSLQDNRAWKHFSIAFWVGILLIFQIFLSIVFFETKRYENSKKKFDHLCEQHRKIKRGIDGTIRRKFAKVLTGFVPGQSGVYLDNFRKRLDYCRICRQLNLYERCEMNVLEESVLRSQQVKALIKAYDMICRGFQLHIVDAYRQTKDFSFHFLSKRL